MSNLKTYLINFIWGNINISDFENWLYNQNPIEFEKLLGKKSYNSLLSINYKNKELIQINKEIKKVLTTQLINEFNLEFLKKRTVIKGVCIKNHSLDYYGEKERKWDLKIGKEYEFIAIQTGIERENDNHSAYVSYIDRDFDLRPSGKNSNELV